MLRARIVLLKYKFPGPGIEPRSLACQAGVLTTTLHLLRPRVTFTVKSQLNYFSLRRTHLRKKSRSCKIPYLCIAYEIGHPHNCTSRFNKIAIQTTAQMAADKEAVGLSRVHTYESKCLLLLRDNFLFCP